MQTQASLSPRISKRINSLLHNVHNTSLEIHPTPTMMPTIHPEKSAEKTEPCHQRKIHKQLARNAALWCRQEFTESFCDVFERAQENTPAAHRCIVAPFERSEINLGRRIGTGSFSEVYEIKSFNLHSSSNYKSSHNSSYTPQEIEKRKLMAKETANSTSTEYVLKQLKPNLESSPNFPGAARDITFEAELLSAVDHPNIIKIHGISALRHDALLEGEDGNNDTNGFFIILEKLDEILDDRIKFWSSHRRHLKSKTTKLMRSPSIILKRLGSKDRQTFPAEGMKKESPSLMEEQIDVLISLASAMDYLHHQNIIFRDLKPSNVGIDCNGEVKLFDFGLARLMPSIGDICTDVFKMSQAGTPRYSPPEVLASKPYNAKADVYSFAIVLWEILSLELPFSTFTCPDKLSAAVCQGGERPRLDPKWSKGIKETIARSFSNDVIDRPSMNEVLDSLHEFLCETREEFSRSLIESRNRRRDPRSQLSFSLTSVKRAFKFSASDKASLNRQKSSPLP